MLRPINAHHWFDADGNPAGGTTYGEGFAISWQNGPLGRGEDRREPNGAFVESIIAAVMDRIEWYQTTQFACDTNHEALAHLEGALFALERRTLSRDRLDIEGTHERGGE